MKAIVYWVAFFVTVLGVTAVQSVNLVDDQAHLISDAGSLESILAGYQSTSGDIILVRTSIQHPTDEIVQAVIDQLETEVGFSCGFIIFYSEGEWLEVRLEATPKCQYVLDNLNFNTIIPPTLSYKDNKEYDGLFRYLAYQLHRLNEPKVRDVRELTIEAEKNAQGIEYGGLIAAHGNTMTFSILYPQKFGSASIQVVTNKQGGKITLPDSSCSISFQLIESGTGNRGNGGLLLDEGSLQTSGKFTLTYYPPKDRATRMDILQVSMDCPSSSYAKSKNIPVQFNPLVFFVPGYGGGEHDYDPLRQALSLEYPRQFFYMDYQDTNLDDIRSNAQRLSQLIDRTVRDTEEQRLLKVGKITLVAHSVGGLVARNYASSSDGHKRVGKLITVSTPHLGAPLFQIIVDACPPPYDKPEPDHCPDYNNLVAVLQRYMHLPALFGRLGDVIEQLTPFSNFVMMEGNTLDGIPLTFIAGNKPYAPTILEHIGTLQNIADAAQLALIMGTEVPLSMKKTLDDFLNSFVAKDTDGRIPITSSLWAQEASAIINQGSTAPLILPWASRKEVAANHAGTVNSQIGQAVIIREINDMPYTYASVGSPVNLYMYDQYGNVVGVKEGNRRQDSPDALFLEDEQHAQSVLIDGTDNYTFVVEGDGDGTFSLTVNQHTDTSDTSYFYDEVTVTPLTKSSFDMRTTMMQVDREGDGIIDEVIPPSTYTAQLLQEQEPNFTKDVVVKTDHVEPSRLLWISIPVILVVILSVLFWWYRRRFINS
ncbi:MAG TPA: hypothetical protein VJH97_05145 [Candidatus Nanoarchaeia archaeon]|nr:hypothetical protein [Candidatus Nanoarchaeia archaeon]